MSLVQVERTEDGRVATVTLNRPEQRNALSLPLLEELTDAFGALAADSGVRAIILAAAGPDFCAGADFAELERARAGGSDSTLHFDDPFRAAMRAMARHPVPVIARVQGSALGGGCQVVLACDLAVAANDAMLGIPSSRLGIVIPFESMQRLVLAVGPRRAGELLHASRTVSGAQALAWGLVSEAVDGADLDVATATLAGRIASAAPLSVRASKRGIALAVENLTLDRGGETPRVTDYDLMAAQALSSRDLAEGITAFRERRTADFDGS